MTTTSREDRHTTASAQEREACWQDVPPGERMARWEARMNQYLAAYTADPANRDGRLFLQKLLREQADQPLAAVEVSARALYTTFFNRDGTGEIAGFVRRLLTTTTRQERDANGGLIENLAHIYGPESATRALRLIREHGTGTPLGTDIHTGEEVLLPHRPRPHVFICGNTGVGKSALSRHLALADIRAGHGVAVIEPHGTLVRDILAGIPESRVQDVLYLDLMDAQAPFGLNLFACPDPTNLVEAAKVSSFLLHLFERVWGTGLQNAPLVAMVVRHLTATLVEHGLTLSEAPLLLYDAVVRHRLTATLTNRQSRLFWQDYERRSQRDRTDLISSTVNKLDALLSSLCAPILSQQTTVPFRHIMDEGKILLVQLSPLVQEASRLIGASILAQLLMASFSRISDTPEEKRKPFFVYCDEWHHLVTEDAATWIHEARKASVVLHLANQSLEQLPDANRAAALSAGALVVFRVSSPDDSKTFAASFDHTPPLEQTGVEPVRAPVSDVVGHLVRRGHTNPVVGRFVSEYLMPLEALIRKVGVSQHAFTLGCAFIYPSHLIDGQRLVNECLSACMQTGRADGFISPLALLILGGAADERSTDVFQQHIRSSVADGYVLKGFSASVNLYGRPGFRTEQGLTTFLASSARPGLLRRLFGLSRTVPDSVTAFARMLRSFREVMEILATEPILVDTGQYAPVFRPRPYQDVENQIANELTQLENFTCWVKLLTGEHVIRTTPPPTGIAAGELAERIQRVKQHMRRLGYVREAKDVAEDVEKRHAQLRSPDSPGRGADRPPPASA
jgi:hypothetical protein